MAMKSKGNEIIRHGEAVGIGMLCEIYYSSGKNKIYQSLIKILKDYGLPINLKKFLNKKNPETIKNQIFKNIFLDKKRINFYPRSITLRKICSPKIIEMRDSKKIIETIKKVIF